MTIHVSGDPLLTQRVSALIVQSGQHTRRFRFFASVSAELVSNPDSPYVELDGVDGPYESSLLKHLTELTSKRAVVVKRGNVTNDRHVKIAVPPGEEDHVAQALVRATYETRK